MRTEENPPPDGAGWRVRYFAPEVEVDFCGHATIALGEGFTTGAAAAALGGYLRDIGWPHGGCMEVVQGGDMGMRSRLHVGISPALNAGVRVSGAARLMGGVAVQKAVGAYALSGSNR